MLYKLCDTFLLYKCKYACLHYLVGTDEISLAFSMQNKILLYRSQWYDNDKCGPSNPSVGDLPLSVLITEVGDVRIVKNNRNLSRTKLWLLILTLSARGSPLDETQHYFIFFSTRKARCGRM